MPESLKLSVVIPTLGREARLRATIQAILGQLKRDMELLVVDQSDSHEPETEKLLGHDRITWVKETERSAARARNVGLERSRGEVVLFLDDDIEFGPDFLAAHLKNYEDASVDAVAGAIHGEREPKLNIDGPGYVTFYGRYRRNLTYPARADTTVGGSGNLSARAEAIRAVGGWDEGFIGNDKWGDVDLCFRLRAAGHRLIYDPASTVTHLQERRGGTRTVSGWERYYYEVYYNDTRFFWRHRSHWALPIFLAAQKVKILKLALTGSAVYPLPKNPLASLAGLYVAFYRGAWDGIRNS